MAIHLVNMLKNKEKGFMEKYRVIKKYNDAPENPINSYKGEKLKFIEESDPSGEWPNWIFCIGTTKEGWIPKQILKINERDVESLEEYTSKENNLEINE